ncbi:MAG: hypothetical protein ACE5E4_04285 [Candidatus Binatia bacterium]
MINRVIDFLQYFTIAFMWTFAVAITIWVVRLGFVSYELADAFTASVGITMVAIPIFWALAGVLTYTFFGLRRGAKEDGRRVAPDEPLA